MQILHRAIARVAGTLLLPLALGACGTGSSDSNEVSSLSPMAALGENIFKDTNLSASGKQSCATCHAAEFAHSPSDGLPAQMGGVNIDRQGTRHTPTIRYLAANTAFFFDKDDTPTGGFFWDGRAASLKEQAGGPFLNPVEMANVSKADVVRKVARASYATQFQALFGAEIFNDTETAFDRITLALQQYQLEDAEFNAYTSKYDEFLRGHVQLSDPEGRGLALFNSPQKGNCAACHPSSRGADGSLPLFTDFTYDNLGVPRNSEIAVNADSSFFDLGLCARTRGDLLNRTDLCGAFKVPTLRNVVLRRAFFHNGHFKTLKDVLTFYVQRDTNPDKWYPLNTDGTVNKFNDLPMAYKANVNTSEAPYNRKLGDAPALTDAEIDDVIAFLSTLTDGYVKR